MSDGKPALPAPGRADLWQRLRGLTAARIGIGRAGSSVPTESLLEFQLAHARARDAVHHAMNAEALAEVLRAEGWTVETLHSAAADRDTYIRRPDLGRILDDAARGSLDVLGRTTGRCDVVFAIADGLSALAVERHAATLLREVRPQLKHWRLGPVCVVQQGRVAVGDEIGALLGARLVVVLIGERPGLSSPDSLGVYLTWDPVPGRSNAERNCISNVRPEGLPYAAAATKLAQLMNAARHVGFTGVNLKDDDALPP